MAAELNTIKLDPESHLLLDQPLLRLPHELARRNFKTAQRYVERERESLLPALKEAANASLSSSTDPAQTLSQLDAMIARVQTFQRKLQALKDEDATIHAQSTQRIAHVRELYEIPSLADVKYDNWSRVRLDRLLVDYLLRSGYPRAATQLAEQKNITPLVDLHVFESCSRIASSLRRGETREALSWCMENRAALKKLPAPNDLEFSLRLQQFIELTRPRTAAALLEASLHARKHLYPFQATHAPAIAAASGLLAWDPTLEAARRAARASHPTTPPRLGYRADRRPPYPDFPLSPYTYLYASSRWEELARSFTATHHSLIFLPAQPLLHIALSAGLSALKTPACHSAYASSSANPHSTTTRVCPICSTELNELARGVPYAHHTKSVVEGDPVVLPNGRVYGRGRVEEMRRKMGRVEGVGGEGIRDPVTGEIFPGKSLRKIYIS